MADVPKDIPEDIMQAAAADAAEWYGGHEPSTASFQYMTMRFAKARLSERERRTAQEVTMPAGWKLVPIEPTEAMNSSGADAFFSPEPKTTKDENNRAASVYHRMLAAAPSLSSSAGGGERG